MKRTEKITIASSACALVLRKSCILLILFIAIYQDVHSQLNVDSLWTIWNNENLEDTSRLEAMSTLSFGIYLKSQPDSAFMMAQSQHDLAKSKGLDKYVADALNTQGVVLRKQGDFDGAIEYYEKCQAIYREIGDKKGVAVNLHNIANIFSSKGEFEEAIKRYAESVSIRQELGLSEGVASSLHNMGVTYHNQGDLANAIVNYTRSLSIKEKIGDRLGVARSLNSIGIVHDLQGDNDKAIDFYARSLSIMEEINNQRGIASALNNIGIVYSNKGDFTKALELYKRAMTINEETGNRLAYAGSLIKIGAIYRKQQKYDLAIDYLQRGLRINEEIGNKFSIGNSLLNLATAYLDQGEYIEAINLGEQSLKISKEAGSKANISKAASLLYRAEKALGHSSSALAMHELYQITKDSIDSESNRREIIRQEYKYDYEKKELSMIAEQDKKDAVASEKLRRKNQQRNAFIGGFAMMLLLAGTFFFQRKRISKERERSEELLLNILPEEVAVELKEKGSANAKLFDDVTVVFTDFKGFTRLAEKLSPKDLVNDLNVCFSEFDDIMNKHGIEKIKTIGDAYMAAGGLPTPNNTHATDVINAAIEMRDFVEEGKVKKTEQGLPYFEIRIGIHTGPVVAGIVGVKKFQYDIWGDTVNIASRMESSGQAGQVNISEATFELVKEESDFIFKSRGKVKAKGKGEIEMYFVSKP